MSPRLCDSERWCQKTLILLISNRCWSHSNPRSLANNEGSISVRTYETFARKAWLQKYRGVAVADWLFCHGLRRWMAVAYSIPVQLYNWIFKTKNKIPYHVRIICKHLHRPIITIRHVCNIFTWVVSRLLYYYTNHWSNHLSNTQIPCGVRMNKVDSPSCLRVIRLYFRVNNFKCTPYMESFQNFITSLMARFMAALRSRCGRYIFVLFLYFVLSFFFSFFLA